MLMPLTALRFGRGLGLARKDDADAGADDDAGYEHGHERQHEQKVSSVSFFYK